MKKKLKVLSMIFMFCALLISGIFCAKVSVSAATIGGQLLTPESGWSRYDDSYKDIVYSGDWTYDHSTAVAGSYGNSGHYTKALAGYKFKFYGTKLRLIVTTSSSHPTNIPIKIDGVLYTYSEYSTAVARSVLAFEKTGLNIGYHTVEVSNPTADKYIFLDAIDIDGELVPYDFTYLKAVASTTEKAITLSWDKVDNATGYVVKRSTVTGGDYTSILTTAQTTYTDKNVGNNIAYYYQVNPVINAVNGTVSNEASATLTLAAVVGDKLPAPESGWIRYDDTGSNITYSTEGWTSDGAVDFTGNYLNTGHFSTSLSANYKFVFYGSKLRLITTTNYSHPSAIPIKIDGVTYTYSEYGALAKQILSFEITGLSTGKHLVEVSNPTQGKYIFLDAIDIDANGELLPNELTYLTTVAGTTKKEITLNWITANNATNFDIKRSTVQGGNYTLINTTTETTYIDKNIDNNITYYYRVYALGSEIYSNEASAVVNICLPAPESGWKRYDDSGTVISYSTEGWTFGGSVGFPGNYLDTGYCTSSLSANYNFIFYGTKLRLITTTDYTHPSAIPITIDGVPYTYSEYGKPAQQIISFEITGLNAGYHTVKVSNPTEGKYINLDAFDIDQNGELVPFDFTYLRAVASTTKREITLNWDKVVNATIYSIERSTIQGGDYTQINTTTDTSYVDKDVNSNITYYYRINPQVSGTVSNEASATVKIYLPVPESEWKRYDDTNNYMFYSTDGWSSGSAFDFTGNYLNTGHFTSSLSANYKFTFYGTKVRLITTTNYSHPTDIPIKIDGVPYTYSEYGALARQILSFEITGLNPGYHTVEVSNPMDGKYIHLDAIDIDENGELVPWELTNLAAVASTTNNEITLNWVSCNKAPIYSVERSTVQGGDYTQIGTTTDTTYIDNNVNSNITYYYRIYPQGSGIYSNEASAIVNLT